MIWDLRFRGKPINFTRHAFEELDESGKTADLVLDVLERGIHTPEGCEKVIVKLPSKDGRVWEMVYVERDDFLIIHLKKVRK